MDAWVVWEGNGNHHYSMSFWPEAHFSQWMSNCPIRKGFGCKAILNQSCNISHQHLAFFFFLESWGWYGDLIIYHTYCWLNKDGVASGWNWMKPWLKSGIVGRIKWERVYSTQYGACHPVSAEQVLPILLLPQETAQKKDRLGNRQALKPALNHLEQAIY